MEILCFVLFSLFAGACALTIFLWQLKKGQFEDMEETKYQIFREDDDAEISK
ncbi:MAG: cbb3-type cytochrome oxidase assembly protein CcoS [Chlamydiales bacterium]|nr:cbb3-type cytochrome oxidase assembly protein CcoS [Chlamydiales bacterium]